MARYTQVIYPVKKLVPLTSEMADAIGEYRHRQRIASENEAIRQLIEAGLKGVQVGHPVAGASRVSQVATSAAQSASKPSRPRRPRAKPLAMSKEPQIRAVRERDSG